MTRPRTAEYEIGDRRLINVHDFRRSATHRYRMIVAVDIAYHWEDAHDGIANHGPHPDLRLQITPLQQCVDLRTTELSPVEIWRDIDHAKFDQIDVRIVSEALDEILWEHGGSASGAERFGKTLIEHPAPEELRNFGSVYGLSSERVWGHTTGTVVYIACPSGGLFVAPPPPYTLCAGGGDATHGHWRGTRYVRLRA